MSQLVTLTEAQDSQFPDVEQNALSVMDAVQNLVDVGKAILAETSDEVG